MSDSPQERAERIEASVLWCPDNADLSCEWRERAKHPKYEARDIGLTVADLRSLAADVRRLVEEKRNLMTMLEEEVYHRNAADARASIARLLEEDKGWMTER